MISVVTKGNRVYIAALVAKFGRKAFFEATKPRFGAILSCARTRFPLYTSKDKSGAVIMSEAFVQWMLSHDWPD